MLYTIHLYKFHLSTKGEEEEEEEEEKEKKVIRENKPVFSHRAGNFGYLYQLHDSESIEYGIQKYIASIAGKN
jgi:hypothetical protein